MEITTHHVDGNRMGLLVNRLSDNDYQIRRFVTNVPDDAADIELCRIQFQTGPIPQGVNGVTSETLLAIVLDRLERFQAGQFPCEENATAIEGLRSAMDALHARTRDRVKRNVEGTYAV